MRLHDSNLTRSFKNIIGCILNDAQNKQLFLSIKHGRFGFQRTTDVSPCAFIGSWASSLCNLPARSASFRAFCPPPVGSSCNGFLVDQLQSSFSLLKVAETQPSYNVSSWFNALNHPLKLQHEIRINQQNALYKRYLNRQDVKDRARLLSCGGSSSGCWLQALPRSHDLSMKSAEFSFAAQLRFGTRLPALEGLTLCVSQCGKELDKEGFHAISCKWEGGGMHRQDGFLHRFYIELSMPEGSIGSFLRQKATRHRRLRLLRGQETTV